MERKNIDWEYETEKLASKFVAYNYSPDYLTTKGICEDEVAAYMASESDTWPMVRARIRYRLKNGIDSIPWYEQLRFSEAFNKLTSGSLTFQEKWDIEKWWPKAWPLPR